MNAIFNVALAPATEVNLSSAVSLDDITSQFHERMRTTLDRMAENRRRVSEARSMLSKVDFGGSSVHDLESGITDFENLERSIKIDRRLTAQQVKTMRQTVTLKGRGYLRPIIDRVGHACDLYLVERLELVRDARLLAIAELADRELEKDGPIIGTPADLKAYFDRLIAA